ncbi:MAG: copper homeostasis membrane protein CopD [Janthinobacterium lividum]|uniref:copper homeostasis membrane protein CopD n=1 Tax=Pseudomonas sp. MWU16-30317 TaxID=2878095 RepID=UPI001CF9BC84|nr:copper homeostasis membrane protein CopD [Pseudomonas sp. MWU16-30317]
MSVLVLLRFVHFSAVLVLFGVSVFRPLLVGSPALLANLRRRMDPFLCIIALLAFLSAVGWLLAAAADMAGSWPVGVKAETLRKVLFETFFGKVWAVHVVLCLVQLVYWRIPGGRSARIPLVLASLVLLTLAPVGHGAMFNGIAGVLLIANQALHLACTGAWLGALTLLAWVQNRPQDHDLRALLARFSGYGLWLVAGIIASGIINVRAMTGTFLPGASGFAWVLGIKLVLVLGMLILANYNRRCSATASLERLRASVSAEWLLGFGALAAVSLLGTLAPVPLN